MAKNTLSSRKTGGAGGAGPARPASRPSNPASRSAYPPARPVYSTEHGTAGRPRPAASCPRCGGEPCRCEPARSLPAGQQDVRVRREKAGRGGKVVTTAGPLVLVRADAAALLAELKRRYGSGGSLQTSQTRTGDACFQLEIQGDHADRLLADLTAAGYPAKRAGG